MLTKNNINNNAFIILSLFIIPILVQLFFPLLNITLFNPYVYPILLLIFILFFYILNNFITSKKVYKITNIFYLNLIIFNSFELITIFFKGLYDNDLLNAYRISLPFLGSLLIINLLKQKEILKEFNYKLFFNKFSFYLGIFVIIQVLLSMYESVTGNYLVSTKYLGSNETRDILIIFGYSLSNLLGFRFLFGGIYFHHNVFGTVLLLYNFIFLIRYYESRKLIFLLFLTVVFIAVLGNTSRFAIFTIILTNLIIFYKIFKKTTKFVIIPITVVLLSLYFNSLIHKWNLYFNQSNSLIVRENLWSYLFKTKILSFNLKETFIGLGIHDYINFASDFSGKSSLENTYLIQFVLLGIIGLSSFLFVFHIYPLLKARRIFGSEKIFIVLFVLNIFLPSLVGATFFYFPCYILLSIIYSKISFISKPSYK